MGGVCWEYVNLLMNARLRVTHYDILDVSANRVEGVKIQHGDRNVILLIK